MSKNIFKPVNVFDTFKNPSGEGLRLTLPNVSISLVTKVHNFVSGVVK